MNDELRGIQRLIQRNLELIARAEKDIATCETEILRLRLAADELRLKGARCEI
jgi:hypothetical protein